MRLYTILRLGFACFLLYVALPIIPTATTQLAKAFWLSWLIFFLLVMGGNLATLLHISQPPVMEQSHNEKYKKQSR